MNQIQYTTDKKHCLFVMLPDGASNPRLWNLHNEPPYLTYQYGLALKRTPIDLIGTGLNNLGFVSELTDEQKEGVIPNVDMTGYGKLFPNYLDDEGTLFMDVDQSFETLTDFLKVYIDNPYGDEPKQNEDRFLTKPHNLHMTDVWKKEYDVWKTAQQNVGNWCLLTCNK